MTSRIPLYSGYGDNLFRKSPKWPKPPGSAIGVSDGDLKDAMVKKPTDNVTLSADAGEALIARVHQRNLGAEDARIVEWVIRMYFWVVFALQEAKCSVKRLRNIFFGQGSMAKTSPEPEAAAPASEAQGEDEGGDEPAPGAKDAAGGEAGG